MLAEARVHHRFDSEEHWRPSSPDKDLKLGNSYHREQTVEYGRHASSQKSCFLGFEMATELVWVDWDLGKEFTKTLVIKNTHTKLQKILFRPPVSKFFTSLARQKIVLSPGTAFSIPVTFRPLKRCDYEDNIEFQGKDDRFQVWLRAPAPCHAIEVPESVLLPLCAVKHSTHTSFVLRNVSKLNTFFHWECVSPFLLSPEQGHLKPEQEQYITVAFHPQEALVYQQPVSCKFGTEADQLESCCSVLLQGLAKYPYLEFKCPTNGKREEHIPVMDFGCVAVGHTLHKHFEIYNPSLVPVSFTLSRLSGGITLLGSLFTCDITSAEVAPGASVQATVGFTPTTVDTTSVEYLSLICRGAINKSLLKLTGSCIGPKVSLSSSLLDFGCVDQGKAVAHTVELVNSSQAEAVFQWDLDCSGHSVFCVQPATGIVPPHSHTTLTVSYRPTQPHAHHRRVACLILHREPVFLDLIGTCHSDLPLKQLDHNKPDTKECNQVSLTPVAEYYQSCLGGKDPLSSTPPQFSVSPNELLFKQKVHSVSASLTSQQSVSVTNHSKVKLRLEWTAPSDSSFSVSPLSCELPPLKTTSFRVAYSPKQLNTLHGAQLECFAYIVQDNGHINESLLPSCVTVRVIGHSFEPGKKHITPHCSLEPRLVVFQPLNIMSYRAVLLQNTGDQPLTFCLKLDPDSQHAKAASLAVVPSCGLIQPHTHQILSLRTIPTDGSPKQGFSLHLTLNAADYTEKLTVISRAEQPCVSLEGEGKLYFQPTAVDCLTQRSHQIRNVSHQALGFQWRIPEQDQVLISVEPDAGELHPNESLVQTWSFTPVKEKVFTLKPILTLWPLQYPEHENIHLHLEVTGTGSAGFIQAKEAVLEVEDVLVGGCQSVNIPLMNNSPCSVSFCASVKQKLLDKDIDYDPYTEPCALQLDGERVTISSHSTILLQSTFRPHRKAQYMWTISYQTIKANGSLSSPAKTVCEVYAKGVFPTLQVTDVCGSGSMCQFSKRHMWKLMSLKSLNEHLRFSPCPTELTYRTPTRHSLYCTPSVFTKATVDFNFSAAPLNSDPSTFVLMLYNPGYVPVEWAFLFPEDQQLDLEYWAETGEFSSTELHQMKVQDNRLFTITPRSGKLMSGQQKAVTFSYSHDFAGTDRFHVLFKLSYGKEILLNFQGVTVEVDRPYLHFPSKTNVFTSVAIGHSTPPKQVYQLYNQGAVPVYYEVDKAVFTQIQEDTFNHPVLRCLSPEGEIPPGKTAMLEWIFSPLEARMYQMDIPIHIQNGESTLLRFKGCGINSTTPNMSKPCDYTDAQLLTSCQRVPFPGQPTFLSEDSVSFGDIVVSSQKSKMLFLSNISHNMVRFEWVLPQQSNQPQVVDINPRRGSLFPGGTASFVLTLTATEYPSIYQLDLICQVTLEAALSQYNTAVVRLEEEKERLKHEFTITNKALIESHGTLTDKGAKAVFITKESHLTKYKTLPPIRANNDSNIVRSLSSKITRAERRALRELSKARRDPEPPKPYLMHLWVTAQSFQLTDILTQFPEQLKHQYRCQQADKTQRLKNTCSSQILYTERPSLRQGLNRDITSHVFTSLLRDILDDSELVEDLITLASKPITYKLPETPTPCPSLRASSSNKPESMPHKADEANAEGSEDGPGKEKPFFQCADLPEEISLYTLQNLMMEAIKGELDLTVHPHTVILPPGSSRRRTMSRNVSEDGTEKMD